MHFHLDYFSVWSDEFELCPMKWIDLSRSDWLVRRDATLSSRSRTEILFLHAQRSAAFRRTTLTNNWSEGDEWHRSERKREKKKLHQLNPLTYCQGIWSVENICSCSSSMLLSPSFDLPLFLSKLFIQQTSRYRSPADHSTRAHAHCSNEAQ